MISEGATRVHRVKWETAEWRTRDQVRRRNGRIFATTKREREREREEGSLSAGLREQARQRRWIGEALKAADTENYKNR